jgi:hypothetical protein
MEAYFFRLCRPGIICKGSHTELRGFAPIGMLEYWNDGIMVFGKLG